MMISNGGGAALAVTKATTAAGGDVGGAEGPGDFAALMDDETMPAEGASSETKLDETAEQDTEASADASASPDAQPVVLPMAEAPPTARPVAMTPLALAMGNAANADTASTAKAGDGVPASTASNQLNVTRSLDAWSRAGQAAVVAADRPAKSATAGEAARAGGIAVAVSKTTTHADAAKPAAGKLDLSTLQTMRGAAAQLADGQIADARLPKTLPGDIADAGAATTGMAVAAKGTTQTAPTLGTPVDAAALAKAPGIAADPTRSAVTSATLPTMTAGMTSDAPKPDAGTFLIDTIATQVAPRGDGTAIVTTTTMTVEPRASTTAPVTTTVATSIPVVIDDARFTQACAERVAWAVHDRIQHVQMRLEPPELGPIDVRISIDGDQVHTRFVAAHQQVREAIEASLPKLRELVAGDGLHLASADIGHQRDPGHEAQRAPQHTARSRDDGGDVEVAANTLALPRRRGLLDEYA